MIYTYVIIILSSFLLIFYYIWKNSLTFKVPIYYINIDESVDRKIYIINEFKKFNININRIKGITPNDIQESNKLKYHLKCPTNTDLEFACLLSHLKAIHTSYINNDDYSMIIEDDIIIHRMINFEKLIETTPKDWDILQMFSLQSDHLYPVEDKSLWSKNIGKNFSAIAYIINRKGMKKILQSFYPTTYNKDYNSLILDFTYFNNLCVSDYLLYSLVNTYICRDLFFTAKTTESTLHTEHLPWQKQDIDKTMDLFNKYGYRNLDIGYIKI
jgi:GR25 family glycosyltransferase involved in LPS biosynthesis